jgi:hypothetical protein
VLRSDSVARPVVWLHGLHARLISFGLAEPHAARQAAPLALGQLARPCQRRRRYDWPVAVGRVAHEQQHRRTAALFVLMARREVGLQRARADAAARRRRRSGATTCAT